MRVAPFALIAALALVFGLLPGSATDGPDAHPQAVFGAVGVGLLTLVLVAFIPWQDLPVGLQGIVPLLVTLMVMLIRHSEGIGDSGYTVLYLLPIIWVALFSPGWQVVAMFTWVALVIILPPYLDGPLLGEDHYPANDYRLTTIVLLIILLVTVLMRFGANAAAHDPLTGLPNRRAFMANLRMRAGMAAREGADLTVGMLDLDHFKAYNDTHGHGGGDALLRACADRWRSVLRAGDLLGRVGGEEFGLLHHGAPVGDTGPASRLLAAIPHGQTASIGLALIRPGDDPEAALRRADDALYRAKDSGRARIAVAPAT